MTIEIVTGIALGGAATALTLTAAGRWASRLLPAADAGGGEAWLRGALVAVLFMVWPVAVLGSVGLLTAGALVLVAALLWLASLPLAAAAGGGIPLPRWCWPATLSAAVIGLDLLAFLPAAPNDWDAATYHLYFPARWLQEERLFHVPTVFGDNAAAFAPQNGALFFAWEMALLGSDTLANVSQLLCLGFLMGVLYRTCRLLSIAREPSALAALTLLWMAPVRTWTYSANVDVLLVAAWFGALYWLLLYTRRPQTGTLAACALASGLTAGTKTVGLPLAGLVALFLLPGLLRRRRFLQLGLYTAGVVAGGGWWYLWNLWRYGNPLFPVELSWGALGFPGAYDTGALRSGEFHLDSLPVLAEYTLRRFGVTTWLVIAAGLVALGARAVRDLRRRREGLSPAVVLVSVAILWTGFFAAFVPHNNQTRFLMPVLAVSLVGWALTLRSALWVGPGSGRGLWLLGIAAAAVASRPWTAWKASFETLAEAGVDPLGWILTAAALSGAAAAVLRCRKGRRIRRAVTWGLVALVVLVATHHADRSRAAFFDRADFKRWAEGYRSFNLPSARPLRIAYTGANVPYALVGSGWRHRVVYVNTQGRVGDGFYDFWIRDRRRYPYHKPGIYRGSDLAAWLRHLEQERIDVLVIFALHRSERRTIRSTPDGFPIEQTWARQHPERFEPVFAGREAEIYRVLAIDHPEDTILDREVSNHWLAMGRVL